MQIQLQTMYDNKNSDGDVLIEASLVHSNIDDVLNSFLDKGVSSEAGMIIRLKRNKTCISPLPKLTSGMKKLLFQKGIKPSETGKDAMTKLFRENRKLVVIRLSFESVIVVQKEVLALLKQKIVRQLTNGKLTKKRVDSMAFMSILLNRHQNKRDETRSTGTERQVFLHGKSQRSPRAFKNRRLVKCCKQTKTPTVSLVKPRKYHSTTVVNDTQKDPLGQRNAETVFSAPVKCGDLTYIVSPNDSQEYNNPLLPEDGVGREDGCHAEDKFPTQVTEVDAGQLSFKSTYRALTAQTDGNPQSWQNSDYGDSQHRLSSSDRNIVASGTGLPRHTNQPRYPDYALERQRLASFLTSKWDMANKPDPSVLADCGFFFTGNLDLVRCHQCGIGLKDWIKEDDVLTEHVKYSASCDYLILKLGQVRVERMKIAVLNNDATSSNAVQLPYKIRSPRYQTMEARMTSFKNFPQHLKLQHQQFAVAGLFYTGKGDLCRCFTCDGGLKDWSTGDDPIKEHAKYFPNCTYINQLKGQEYVLSLQQRDQDNELAGATGSNNAVSQPTETSGIYVQNDNSAYSSVTISQIVQKLGYAEIDVITAKVELEKKGNRTPTAEDVVNTLLDMQERNESALNASQRDVNDVQHATPFRVTGPTPVKSSGRDISNACYANLLPVPLYNAYRFDIGSKSDDTVMLPPTSLKEKWKTFYDPIRPSGYEYILPDEMSDTLQYKSDTATGCFFI